MDKRSIVIVLGLVLFGGPAVAVESLQSVLQVSFNHAGRDYVFDQNVVPLLPGNACYAWYIRVAEAGAAITAIERFTLPEALPSWGETGSTPDDPTQIEAGGQVAVTTLSVVTDGDGWFSHGWCVAEGDPLGRHTMEVSADGDSLASFAFEVVAPADYAFPPVAPPDPTSRSANDSW